MKSNYEKEVFREKAANYLVGQGFNEMMTNSITNAAYYSEEELSNMVKMMNSLSAELNILRNSLFETSLEVVAHNLNHKNNSLRLFEFGKAYATSGNEKYTESDKLCLVITGNKNEDSWKQKAVAADFYNLKGAVNSVLSLLGIAPDAIEKLEVPKLDNHIVFKSNDTILAGAGQVKKNMLDKFGIKQPVYFAGLNWSAIAELAAKQKNKVKEISKFPSVQRDLAMIVAKELQWAAVQTTVQKIKLNKLQDIKLFDIFESDKLGADKKSLAVNFTFQDEEKTLTDKEIDGWMNKIMSSLEKDLQAEIRK